MNVLKHYLLILAISFLPLIIVSFTPQLFHTHDGMVHLARMAAYQKALSDGQILPRWASDLNFGYGMPLFNFIYHTPYFLSALLISLGFSLVSSFKIVVIFSFLLSGITMFAFSHALLGDTKKAFFVTIFYQFAPFHLVEILVRGSFGEMYTYAFLPLVLLGLTKLSKKPALHWIIITAVATGLLIVSHNSISLVFFGVSSLFVLFFFNKKNIVYGITPLLLGLTLASFYWLPALLEHKYTLGDLYMRDIFRTHFPPLMNFFIPNLFNAKSFQTGGVDTQFGFFHVLAIFAAIGVIVKRVNSIKKITTFSLILVGLSLFFMQPVSIIFWEKISFLRQFQFPWRLLSIVVLATSLLSVNFFSYKIFTKKWFYIVVLIGTVISTAYYWYPPLGFDEIKNEREYWDYQLTTTYFGETDVIWSAGPAKAYPKQQMETVEGEAKISKPTKRSTIHTAMVQSQDGARLVDNTQYFPGWRVYVNNKKVPVEFQDPNWRGLITFAVPKGQSTVRVVFEKSKIQTTGEYISLATAILLLGTILVCIRRKCS